MTEAETWLKHDKHSLAFELLSGPRAKQMGERLGIDPQAARQCLSCHAGWSSSEAKPPKGLRLGVSCESCHGPSSQWDRPHSELSWRRRTPREKQRLGMVDVRNPAVRAQLCQSCHIGDSQAGKVLTHDMYVAGHPPLPSIEVETFIEQMPSHWRSLQEKGDFASRREYVEVNQADGDRTSLTRTRSVLVGGLHAMRVVLRLHASQFESEAGEGAAGRPQWPEYALFDCAACHHELRSKSWRQQRGYQGPPGRPPISAWPAALAPLAIRQVARSDDDAYARRRTEFHDLWRAVQEANGRQPFGKAAEVRPASERLVRWLSSLAAELETQSCDPDDVRRTLREAIKISAEQVHDYESARQLTWSIRVMASELRAPYPPSGASAEQFSRWRSDVRAPAQMKVDTVIRKLSLSKRLSLKLPAGRSANIEEAMPAALEKSWKYDAGWFQRQAATLSSELLKP